MEFFAVTETSLYQVSDEKEEKTGFPMVEKIAIRKGKKSGVSIGTRLRNGHLVGVTNGGIVLYNEDHPGPGRRQSPEMVNLYFWGGHTTSIVALFLNKDEAAVCLNSKKSKKSVAEWNSKTKEVLEAIGNNHPIFVISSFVTA